MRKFDSETAALAVELEQLVVDYWREVDANGGANATGFFTEDVVADFGAIRFSGHEGVRGYYADRAANIARLQQGGVRTTRHVYHNLQIVIESPDRAMLSFLVVTYGGGGHPPVLSGTMAVSISDTRFECRREADGEWRIFGFYGMPVFIGDEDFARRSLLGS